MSLVGEKVTLPAIRLSQLFDAAVIIRQDRTAIFDEDSKKEYTYAELSNKANQLARYIKENMLSKSGEVSDREGLLIALCMAPSTELIISLIAILKLEGAYIPIDVTFPATRIEYIINDSKPNLILTNGPVENLEEADLNGVTVLSLNEKWALIETLKTGAMHLDRYAKDPLFAVLYTSGSTGMPKGVKLSCTSILNRLYWQWNTFKYTNDEVCCFKTPLIFVDSISEIYGPLLTAHKLVIIPKCMITEAEILIGTLNKHKIRRLVLVPSLLRSILFHCSKTKKDQLPFLRLWICSGEIFPCDLLEDFFKIFPAYQKEICNFYGSTEVVGDVTYKSLNHSTISTERFLKNIPIGVPVYNSEIYLVNEDMKLITDGKVGEILVSGKNLCRGYIGIDKSRNFIENTFNKEKGFEIVFRTGDFGRIEGGLIYFEGRKDSQVKIRGHRIDLIEIQNCLQSIEGVERGRVLCYHPCQIDQMLIAFYTKKVSSLRQNMVQCQLRKHLPIYMIPQVYEIKELPLLVNGKIDCQQLLDVYEGNTKDFQDEKRIIMDDCPIELKKSAKILLQASLKALGPNAPKCVSLHDNYHKIGGNSLNILVLLGYMQDMGYYVGIQEFITAANFREILPKISLDSKCLNNRYFDEKTIERYKIRSIEHDDVDTCLQIICTSFSEKGSFEARLGVTYETMEFTDRQFPWYGPNEFTKLSFLLYDTKTNEIVGVALNTDFNDDVILTSEDPAFHNELTYLEECENDATCNIGEKKILHSVLLSTKNNIPSLENINLVYAMEKSIIDVAKKYNYDAVITSNSSSATQYICQDVLDYKILKTYQVKSWLKEDGSKPFENFSDDFYLTVDIKYV